MLDALQPWWPDWASFLAMGRHGAYVWSAFGLCALALALEGGSLARQARRQRAPEAERP
ncbi:MAG: heme exporter protein CcmD [Proteobacteria bacterium]|nr:heme exporter protein CcmD [Pseudomonadota bacterium]